MYSVYSTHKGGNVTLPPVHDPREAYELACVAARLGHDVLYRVFEQTSDSPTGERYLTAWSVLGGVVREHKDVTIPAAHW